VYIAAMAGEDSDSSGDGGDAEHLGLIARAVNIWRSPSYRFALLFLPYLAIVSIGYPIFVKRFSGILDTFITATASIEYWIFLPFTDAISVHDKLVVFDGFSVKIIDECTGIYEMVIFAAAVLAFPTAWSKKFTGLLMGCPLIYLFNVVRIAMLIVVGRYWPDAFDFMHLYFWQATMIMMITSIWLLWIVKVVRTDEIDSAVTA
jgi:archaeosortase B (VPXXXP-CTERM-specific)